MKANAILSNLLTSKVVLTIIFWLSLTNIIGYLIYNRFDVVVFFVLISVIITYFSKNMIIILGVPLILVNLSVLGKNKFKEGLEGQTAENAEKEKKVDGSQPNVISPPDVTQPTTERVDTEVKTEKPDSFEVGRNKNKSKYNIDYAATIEDAYDELNNILGSDGIKNLTSDTQNLMQQQKQLTEAMTQIQPLMQTVGPLLDQAKTMMGSMQNQGGMEQLNKMAAQFKPSAVKK
jgi:hypothetical protein